MLRLHLGSIARALGFAAVALIAPRACALGVATALVKETQQLPGGPAGHIVNSINNTAVNHAGGYAVNVNTTDGVVTLSRIWGNASGGPGSVIRTEATFGSLVQTSYESFYGISNAGQVCYSASGTGGPVGNFDSVWLDDTPIAVQGNPVPSIMGLFWTFGSRPGVTADGKPYWAGGTATTAGGSTSNRGYFFGAGATPFLLGGTTPPGLPFALATGSVNFDYRYSALGTHSITGVVMVSGSTLHDDVVVLDGAGLVVAGTLVREQNPVPAAAGGLAGENWDNFDFFGATEAGDWFFTGDTEPATATDEIIVKNGLVLFREGDSLDGEVLSGAIEGAYMNEDADIAFIWDVQGGVLEALYINDQLVLKEGDAVDLSGDGVPEANAKLVDFTGISSLTLSDRDMLDNVRAYFTADVDTLGTASATDDIEAFFCIEVNVGVPVPVTLASFTATSDPSNGAVTLRWETSLEHEHAGFWVERGGDPQGPFERLDGFVPASGGRYEFLDATSAAGMTYTYRLIAVDRSGREADLGLVTVATSGWKTALSPCAPNPFTDATSLHFQLARAGDAEVVIHDAAGRLVRRLSAGPRAAGAHALRWDGRDEAGRQAAGGVYFVQLHAAGRTQVQKVLRVHD